MRPRVLFHAPKKIADHGHVKWRVRIFVRRANGEPAPSAQTFDTDDEAWQFIRESCTDIAGIVA